MFDIKDVMDVPRKDAIKTPSWNAEEAFNRLKVARETRKVLIEGISANSRDIPPRTKARYEAIIEKLEQIESDETATIRWGE